MIRHRDGRCYIGSAVNLLGRKRQHFSLLQKGEHPNFKLQSAWMERKTSKDFTWHILKRCPVDILIETEQRFIEKFNSVKEGFNIAPLAGKVTFGKAFRMRSKGKKHL
jgi:group I intron endonuclease